MGDDIRCGKIKLSEFIIHKQLGKPREDYPMPKPAAYTTCALNDYT